MTGKIIKVIATIIQILLIAGSIVMEYFARNRMGMMRHMAYVSRKWRENPLVSWAGWIVLLLLAVFVIIIAAGCIRRKRAGAEDVLCGGMALAAAGFIAGKTTTDVKCYYYISTAMVVIVLLQAVKWGIRKTG